MLFLRRKKSKTLKILGKRQIQTKEIRNNTIKNTIFFTFKNSDQMIFQKNKI